MRRDAAVLEARRLAALPRIQRGESLSAIARQLGVSRQAVHQWAQRGRRRGAAGLRRTPHPGRPPKLARAQLAQLPRLLARGPEAYGFPTGVWTSQRVADLIRKRFGVRYDHNYVWHLLELAKAGQTRARAEREGHPALGRANLATRKKNARRG